MQAISVIHENILYDDPMQKGRPSKSPRSPLGERLASAREQMGLSQVQLADKLGVTQKLITYWEHNDVALRVDQLTAIAKALNLSLDELLGQPTPKSRVNGPIGKARLVFESVSKLPKRQQTKILEVVEALVNQHAKAA